MRGAILAIYLTRVSTRTTLTAVLQFAAVLSIVASCTRPEPPAPQKAAEAPGLGEVMVTVGRRFEMAGRAAVANRWELAAFEAGELGELFESDVPHAQLPKEGPTAQIPGMASAFLQSVPPDLQKAAEAKDHTRFTAAFERAAAQCNACHASAEKAFIQVPSVPGQSVPVVDPLPAAGPSAPPSR